MSFSWTEGRRGEGRGMVRIKCVQGLIISKYIYVVE